MKSQGIPKVMRIHPLGRMNICENSILSSFRHFTLSWTDWPSFTFKLYPCRNWYNFFPLSLQILTALDRDGYCRKHKLRHKLEQAINLMSGSSWEEGKGKRTDGPMDWWMDGVGGEEEWGRGKWGHFVELWTVWTVSWTSQCWTELKATASTL